jgi:hypothetical protein
MNTQVWIGIILPFLGTCLGAAMVFVLKDRIPKRRSALFGRCP